MNKQTENYCYSLGFEFGNYQAKETLIIKDVPTKVNIDNLSVLVLAYKGIYVTLKKYKEGDDLFDEYMRVDSFNYKKLNIELSELNNMITMLNIDTIYYNMLVENLK